MIGQDSPERRFGARVIVLHPGAEVWADVGRSSRKCTQRLSGAVRSRPASVAPENLEKVLHRYLFGWRPFPSWLAIDVDRVAQAAQNDSHIRIDVRKEVAGCHLAQPREVVL